MHLSADTLLDDGARSAAVLAAAGVGVGDVVALRGAQTRAYVAALVGLWRLGAVAAPVALRLPPGDLARRLAAVGARWLVGDADGEALPGVRTLPLPDLRAAPLALPRWPDSASEAPDAPALFVFTSGSSGAAKAARLSRRALVASADGVNARIGFGPDAAWLLALPLVHVGGVGVLVRALVAGAAVVLPTPGAALGAVLAAHRPTHVSLVPTQLARLLASTPEVLDGTVVMLGGGPIAPSLVAAAARSGVRVATSYGLTEMASAVTMTAPGAPAGTLATAGTALDGREVRVVEAESGADADSRADAEGAGEIVVRGATRFDGYATLGGFTRPFDADGWFETRDIGYLDGAGRLVVSGRRDRMFVSGGENVHPEAIERHLVALDGVGDAVVVAVPDADFGARAFAFLAPSPGAEAAFDLARLVAMAAERLPGPMRPVGAAALPASPGLKPDRSALEQLARTLAGQG